MKVSTNAFFSGFALVWLVLWEDDQHKLSRTPGKSLIHL
jgi:hypothetical protein